MSHPSSPFTLLAPLTGRVVPLADVPDPVFSSGMLGDGIGIDPAEGRLVAPCAGTIVQLAATGHALTLVTDGGGEILLHVGIDTVELDGEGFHARVAEGARVAAGDVLVDFDLATVTRRARSPVSVVLIANGDAFALGQRAAGTVTAGATPLLAVGPAGTAPVLAGASAAGDAQVRRVVLTVPGGLHARPAARARAAARELVAHVEVRFGGRTAPLDSVVALLGLGAGEGAAIDLVATGPQAGLALGAVAQALAWTASDVHAAAPAAATDGKAGPANVAPHDAHGAPSAAATPGAAVAPDTLAGVCAAPGIAVGTLVHRAVPAFDVPEHAAGAPADERRRLDTARAAVDADLAAAVRQAAHGAADVFSVHRVLLDDPVLLAAAHGAIAAGGSAGHAWRTALRTQADVLARLDDRLLAERAADLRDIEARVLRALGHAPAAHVAVPDLPDQAVLAADEFTPSELAALDGARVAALVMARGGATSHAALIARQRGIPALVAVGDALHALPAGREVVVDATAGHLRHAPTVADLERARQLRRQAADARAAGRAQAAAPAVTRDGVRIEVAANVATADDARQAVAHGADGVGLLRTELLFMDRPSAPGSDEQRAAVQAVVEALDGRLAIVRTLDAGADKPVAYVRLPPEPNPALGLRGIRLAQVRPDLFDEQVRGLLGVRPAGALRLLLPMVTDAAELVRLRERIDGIARILGRTDRIEVGVMVEVPSAALLADQLARHADFLSIGTNDLTQYTLAMDRCHPALAAQADGLHPAVLRLVDATVRGARAHGRLVGVCGALAADPDAVPVLVGLGVTELSVDPVSIPGVKARVRGLDAAHCRAQAQTLLACASAEEVRTASRAAWPVPPL